MSTTVRPSLWARTTLGDVLDPRENGLNLVRLILASSVLFWHAYPLTGTPFPFPVAAPFSGQVAVDGFFAISGFLLAGSWLHSPRVIPYLRNRALRIVPAFWVCLVVVAVGFAPIAALLRGESVAALWSGPHSAWHYMFDNALLRMHFYDVAGSPAGIPFPGAWNGSLWTLWWEALAYLGLLLIGILGILRHRRLTLLVLAAVWLANTALAVGLIPEGGYQTRAGRLGLMFLCGVVIYLYRDKIPVSRALLIGAAALLPVSWLLPDFHILGAPLLAYLVLWAGSAVRSPRLQLRDRDISYGIYIYGFPVQQALALGGAAVWHPMAFALVALVLTAPLAVTSWVLVERPALRWKKSSRRPKH